MDRDLAIMQSLPLYRLAWFFYLILAIVAVAWIGLRTGEPIAPESFVRADTLWADIGLGLLGAAVLIAGWSVARSTLEAARDLEEEMAELLGNTSRSEMVGLAVLSGFSEELFFRGAMQPAIGWPLATLLFALLHTGAGRHFRLWTVFAAVAGLLFAGLTIWRGSLVAAIVAHVAVNAVNLQRLASESSTAKQP